MGWFHQSKWLSPTVSFSCDQLWPFTQYPLEFFQNKHFPTETKQSEHQGILEVCKHFKNLILGTQLSKRTNHTDHTGVNQSQQALKNALLALLCPTR